MAVTKRVRTQDGKKTIQYRAQVYVSGIRVADRTFDTRGAAAIWHEEENAKRRNGPFDAVSNDTTFDQALDRFVNERMPQMEVSSQQARSTRLVYLRKSPLTQLKMNWVNGRAVDAWIHWLLKSESAQSIKRHSFRGELELLCSVLHWWRNYVDAEFVVPVTRRHREMVKYKKVQPRRPDYYARPEEVRAWIGWLQEHRYPVYFRLASFLVLTGARIGEACGMKWSEVDLENGLARVVRVVAWNQENKQPRIVERTKTDGSNRILMLPPVLIALLRQMREEAPGAEMVFVNRQGDLLKYNAVQSAFNGGFEALNLPWRSTHICRHTYATLAMMATKDIGSVQASLGHKSQAMTQRYAKTIALLQSQTAVKTADLMALENLSATRKAR
ncbi:MAG: tyrosine-type recombinase/integrase [Bdellovibrionota bacterium]